MLDAINKCPFHSSVTETDKRGWSMQLIKAMGNAEKWFKWNWETPAQDSLLILGSCFVHISWVHISYNKKSIHLRYFSFTAYRGNNDLGMGRFQGLNDKLGLMVLDYTLSHQLLFNGY